MFKEYEKAYDIYLMKHKNNVSKAYDWLEENLPNVVNDECRYQIDFGHDASKDKADEYDAYDAYFYGNNKSYEVVENFNKAWLLHIHRNPHHWQYWVLINDDPDEGVKVLDMDYVYIIEMICDWWSFSWASENLYEIFSWYEDRKEHIKLSDRTRNIVESILDNIRKKLDELKVSE